MNNKKPTILYLDDELDNLQVFKAAFRRDFRVLTTTSAQEALHILEIEEIPVIITDQRMPNMTGVEFLDAIPEKNKGIKMILTGFSDVETIIHAINKCDVSQYITKPWDRNELKLVIDNAIEKFNMDKKAKEIFKELKLLNEEFKNENKELQQQKLTERLKSKSFQEFVGMISHEIRTPMNGIINMANLSLLDGEDKKENLKHIIESSNNLLEIIEKLKDKIEVATQNNIINIEFKLKDVLNNIMIPYKENNKNKNVVILEEHKNPQALEQIIIGNPESLCLILDNLLSNAVKYTHKGGIKLYTTLKQQTVDYIEIIFKVMDTGIGIDKEKLKETLSLFSEKKRNLQGASPLDIGLPLVKRLIRSENSELHINSQLGKGSTFSFSMKFAINEK